MRQLNATDASFLNLETGRSPMHLTSLLIFDRALAPSASIGVDEIIATVAERGPLVPRYRERIVRDPLGLGHPWWVDDRSFDPAAHVRHEVLASPGGWKELCAMTGAVAARPLDLSKPLWELTVIEGFTGGHGLPDNPLVVALKTHHAAVDGVTGMQILYTLLDASPNAEAIEAPPVRPESTPTSLELTARALATAAQQPLQTTRLMVEQLPRARQLARGMVRAGKRARAEGSRSAPPTRFGGAISTNRVIDGIAIDLDDVRRIKAPVRGATVNDVVLSVTSGALRSYLDATGELPTASLTAMVPVSLHAAGSADGENRVASLAVSLHTDIEAPLSRLAAIHESTAEAKALSAEMGTEQLVDLVAHAPVLLVTAGTRLAARTGVLSQSRRVFNTTITNVPGPREATYLRGARLVAHYGMGPILDGAGIFHCVHGVEKQLFLTVTSCQELLPDPRFYAECLQTSVDAHLEALSTP